MRIGGIDRFVCMILVMLEARLEAFLVEVGEISWNRIQTRNDNPLLLFSLLDISVCNLCSLRVFLFTSPRSQPGSTSYHSALHITKGAVNGSQDET